MALAKVHLHHSLLPLLAEQPFQRRVLLHGALVGTAQQQPVHCAAQALEGPQLVVPAVLQAVPPQQHLHLRRLPDALGLAHEPAPDQRAGHPLALAGGCTPGQTVRKDGKQHPVGAQQVAGVKAVFLIELPPHAPQILQVDVVIPDGQFGQIGPHPSLHTHDSFLRRTAGRL